MSYEERPVSKKRVRYAIDGNAIDATVRNRVTTDTSQKNGRKRPPSTRKRVKRERVPLVTISPSVLPDDNNNNNTTLGAEGTEEHRPKSLAKSSRSNFLLEPLPDTSLKDTQKSPSGGGIALPDNGFLNQCLVQTGIVQRVRFGIWSSDSILAASACEITATVLYKRNQPVDGGLHDLRMGSIQSGQRCRTCANLPLECPGHNGHHVLHVPVINVEFLTQLHRLLTCVCFFCSRCLIPKHHPRRGPIAEIPSGRHRLSAIFTLCQRSRRCGHVNDHEDVSCQGLVQPIYTKADPFITAKFSHEDDNVNMAPGRVLTVDKLENILRFIPADDIVFLGMHPTEAHPRSMLWKNLIVPPSSIRHPAMRSVGKLGIEDDLTTRLRQIIRLNGMLKDVSPESITLQSGSVVLETYSALQRAVSSYQNNKARSGDSEYGGEKRSIRFRFENTNPKRGRLRYNIFGKRQNECGRSPISPGIGIGVDEIGIPIHMCQELCYPERVTESNLARLVQVVLRGPYVYPGASAIIDPHGKVYDLRYVPSLPKLDLGWIVRRHLIAGDPMLVNRQPTLHRMSMMGHRLRPIAGKAIQLHLMTTPGYNADFDGDEVNIYPLLSDATRAEATEVMSVKENLMRDGVSIIQFVQHTVLAMYVLTVTPCLFGRRDMSRFLMATTLAHTRTSGGGTFVVPSFGAPTKILGRRPYWDGLAVVSLVLPSSLTLECPQMSVVGGTLVRAVPLTKSVLNGILLHSIWSMCGPDAALLFLDQSARLGVEVMARHGMSIGFRDCFLTPFAGIRPLLDKVKAYQQEFAGHSPAIGVGVCGHDASRHAQVERSVVHMLDIVRDIAGEYALAQCPSSTVDLYRRNNLLTVIQSGAKGNLTNMVQINGMLGQQMDAKGMRLQKYTSHYNDPLSDQLRKHGFIDESFAHGLSPTSMFWHLACARDGLMDTAIKVACIGYDQRRTTKAMEDIVVRTGATVWNGTRKIVQFLYGGDGFNPNFLSPVHLTWLTMERTTLVRAVYCWPSDAAACAQMTPTAYARWLDQREGAFPNALRQEIRTALTLVHAVHVMQHGTDYARDKYLLPVHYSRILATVRTVPNTSSDLTPYEACAIVHGAWERYRALAPVTVCVLLHLSFLEHCGMAVVWGRFHLTRAELVLYLQRVFRDMRRSYAVPGEGAGILAAQNCTQPLVQSTFNNFHLSGEAKKTVNAVTKTREIINASACSSVPTMRVDLVAGVCPLTTGKRLSILQLKDIVLTERLLSPDAPEFPRVRSFCQGWTAWEEVPDTDYIVLLLELDRKRCEHYLLTPYSVACTLVGSDSARASAVASTLKKSKQPSPLDEVLSFSHSSSVTWWIALSIHPGLDTMWKDGDHALRDEVVVRTLYETELARRVVNGITGVTDFFQDTQSNFARTRVPHSTTLHLNGSNFAAVLQHNDVIPGTVYTSNIMEVFSVLGIDAANAAIRDEWIGVMISNGASVQERHIQLIADEMCASGHVRPLTHQGICNGENNIIKNASFERTMDAFRIGAASGHLDDMNSVMSSICWNGVLRAGTGAVVLMDEDTQMPMSIADPYTSKARSKSHHRQTLSLVQRNWRDDRWATWHVPTVPKPRKVREATHVSHVARSSYTPNPIPPVRTRPDGDLDPGNERTCLKSANTTMSNTRSRCALNMTSRNSSRRDDITINTYNSSDTNNSNSQPNIGGGHMYGGVSTSSSIAVRPKETYGKKARRNRQSNHYTTSTLGTTLATRSDSDTLGTTDKGSNTTKPHPQSSPVDPAYLEYLSRSWAGTYFSADPAGIFVPTTNVQQSTNMSE